MLRPEQADSVLGPIIPYIEAVAAKFRSFIFSTNDKRAYGSHLFQTMSYVRETVPTLLSVADQNCAHPASDWLRQHAVEEHDHDVVFENDLHELGFSAAEFCPSPSIVELINLERSTAAHADPVSTIFGDIAIMECFPPSGEGIQAILKHYGLPPKVAKGFLLHSDADVEHREEALRWMAMPSINKSIMFDRAVVVCRLFCSHWDWMESQFVDNEAEYAGFDRINR